MCRPCKLPHDEHGNALFDGPSLSQAFNPAQSARDLLRKADKQTRGVARTALEAALMQGMLEIYHAGLKDGILLAYSQDHNEGEPMEKLGVSNEELVKELREKYNELVTKQNSSLDKEASAQVSGEIAAVKARLDQAIAGE